MTGERSLLGNRRRRRFVGEFRRVGVNCVKVRSNCILTDAAEKTQLRSSRLAAIILQGNFHPVAIDLGYSLRDEVVRALFDGQTAAAESGPKPCGEESVIS